MARHAQEISDVSHAFVAARRAHRALSGYPGSFPGTLEEAYEIQDASIEGWDDEVAGWKIGLVGEKYRAQFGEERLAGPIFRRQVENYRAGENARAIFIADGFGAIEAEFVLRLKDDLPPEASVWADRHLARFIAAMHIGVELAGSPLKTINDLGPISIVSDFGNNAGLIVGPPIPDWERRTLETLRARTLIGGRSVGEGSAAKVPGGPLAALRFLIRNLAQRGRHVAAGSLVSTGAVTGVHEVAAGDRASVDFFELGRIDLEVRTEP